MLAVVPVASAEVIRGTSDNDTLVGTDRRDIVHGRAGGDTISLRGDGGADRLFGQEGNDRLFAAADDGMVDTLDCGEHADDRDRAVIRPGDTAVSCERVRTLD